MYASYWRVHQYEGGRCKNRLSVTKIDQISGLILRPFLWPKLTKYLGKGPAHAAFCGGPLPPKLAVFAKKQRTQINNGWIWSITLRPYKYQKHGKGTPTQNILWELKTFKELNPRCSGRAMVGYLPLKTITISLILSKDKREEEEIVLPPGFLRASFEPGSNKTGGFGFTIQTQGIFSPNWKLVST